MWSFIQQFMWSLFVCAFHVLIVQWQGGKSWFASSDQVSDPLLQTQYNALLHKAAICTQSKVPVRMILSCLFNSIMNIVKLLICLARQVHLYTTYLFLFSIFALPSVALSSLYSFWLFMCRTTVQRWHFVLLLWSSSPLRLPPHLVTSCWLSLESMCWNWVCSQLEWDWGN